MSREYIWNYRVTIPEETVKRLEEESGWAKYGDFDDLDALVYAVESCMSPCHFGAGFGSGSRPNVEYCFKANKTKAKVYRAKLDEFLGVTCEYFNMMTDEWMESQE